MFFQNFSQIKSAFFTLSHLNRAEATKSSLNKQSKDGQISETSINWSASVVNKKTHTPQLINQTYLHLFITRTSGFFFTNFLYTSWSFFHKSSVYILSNYKKTFGDGFIYIRGLFVIFFVDACLTDDEPI